MDEAELMSWQSKLLAEKKELEAELGTIGRRDPAHPGEWETAPISDRDDSTRDDVADNLEEMDEREEIESSLEKRLKQVDAALARVEGGTYGVCEVGGLILVKKIIYKMVYVLKSTRIFLMKNLITKIF
jgi:RNA polymerase-binding transcription factor DksA